ncbi:MAG: SDR family oxidoreductase [Hoeflea sp.]|uniref:SDR family oxidoreductase n=1 Tax=Hoeflea sp. TaxID=1940281 RepID=UPI001D44828F|nr:SDR family oxidoreductase [Hoeflea sp.]MBU4531698.1 SDR family oxidoreductase [Alphaproteobacteria bacterium]MBU4544554.1 SDR family oxidoreductase [Alphaproteobacteria bacterium]MBU4552785.1 SDR family oxidoreductase [Alphaproteobacteria bacterium]MBV1724974.1 SDR family oxidoreductase [Hoeflea sp.]MBV1760994.1 SDR family oxidoreductase [Hoeflea sp.]
MNLMIFGAGFSGLAIARALGGECSFAGGTTRGPGRFGELQAAGLEPFIYEGGDPSPDLRAALSKTTHLVMSIAPDSGGDPLLEAFAGGLRAVMPRLEWIGYLSTVGVYGDHGGEWVNEDTICRPVSERSVARLAAEEGWAALAGKAGVPLAVIRLSGIYGPGRNAIRTLQQGRARRLIKPGQVFNRIHVADIGGATALLARKGRGGIFNVTDDMPAPPQDVIAFAAKLMGVEPPPETDFETADLTPMARSFYGENKRVANARIKAAGYQFRYPDYVSGLEGLLRDEA